MISSTRPNVQKGARFPDTEDYEDPAGKPGGGKLYIFRGMTDNPWWHGYNTVNYVSTYIYITQLANKMQYSSSASIPNGLSANARNAIDSDLAFLKKHWSDQAVFDKTTVTKAEKRDFVWGMALHNLADAYAHNAYVYDEGGKKWVHLVHDVKNAYKNNPVYVCADDTSKYPERWQAARSSVNAALCQYEKSSHPDGTYQEFRYVQNATRYKLKNIYEYVMAVAGTSAASAYRSYSTK